MQNHIGLTLMENFVVGVASSIVATILVVIFGKWKGWWWKTKNSSSIELATRTLKYLDGEAEERTNQMVGLTKKLGDSLVASSKSNTQYDSSFEIEALSIIDELVSGIKPLATELSAANPELDDLKRAVNSYQKGLEWRSQIVKHLCHPPNPKAMDAGHVRDQLLSENLLPQKLLQAAQGEVAIFLRGYGVNWIARRKYLSQIVKKQRALCKESVANEYRSVLQQTSLHKAKR